MKINEIQAEIVDEFSLFEDWMEKYEYMIELGKSIQLIDTKNKIDANLIKGCQSKLWLFALTNFPKIEKSTPTSNNVCFSQENNKFPNVEG